MNLDIVPTGQEESTSSWAAIRAVLKGRRRAFGLLAVTSLATGVVEAGLLVLVTRVALTIADDAETMDVAGWSLSIGSVIVAAIGITLVRIAVGLLGNWQGARVTADVVARYRRELAGAYLRAEWTAQQRRHSGQLQALLGAFTANGATLITNIALATRSGFSLAALLVAAVFVDARTSAAVIAGVVLFSLILRPLKHAVRRQARKNRDVALRFSRRLNEISHVTMDIHVFNVHDTMEQRIRRLIKESSSSLRKLTTLKGSVPVLYAGLGYLAVVAALAVLSTSGARDVSSVGAVMVVMLRSLTYGQSLQAASAAIAASAPFVDSLDTELARLRVDERRDGGHGVDAIAVLSMRGVEFRYHADEPVLTGIDLDIGPREIIGVVGPSGGGKTTLMHLILGLRRPTAGTITVDGVDIAVIRHHDWARRVTFVPQQAHLLSGTVAENIRFGRDNVTHEQVIRAATLAHLHDDIVGWPQGYEREVGERGGQLSGGQQQRLSIARALVEDPDLLVLDEPTSALDARSELLIRRTLEKLRETMSVVIVAHRPATLDICDRIMVVDAGGILAIGTRDQLEDTSDDFRRVVLGHGLASP